MKAIMQALLNVPTNQRDEHWEKQFLSQLPRTTLKLLNEVPQSGPDGWPYMMAEFSADPSAEPIEKLLAWLSDKGIGLVLNPKKDVPDFVLTFGMIWNFRERGQFLTPSAEAKGSANQGQSASFQIDEGSKILAGEPTENYLPDYVRNILRLFFRDNDISEMRCLVMSADQENFDLSFSLEALGQPPEAEHHGLLEAISWFLPTHYSLAVVSEKGLPPFFKL